MPWNTYLTLLLQVVIALFVLATPLAFVVYMMANGAAAGLMKFVTTAAAALKRSKG